MRIGLARQFLPIIFFEILLTASKKPRKNESKRVFRLNYLCPYMRYWTRLANTRYRKIIRRIIKSACQDKNTSAKITPSLVTKIDLHSASIERFHNFFQGRNTTSKTSSQVCYLYVMRAQSGCPLEFVVGTAILLQSRCPEARQPVLFQR